jgi:hypothetical protein
MFAGDTFRFGCYAGVTVTGKTVTIAAGRRHGFATTFSTSQVSTGHAHRSHREATAVAWHQVATVLA